MDEKKENISQKQNISQDIETPIYSDTQQFVTFMLDEEVYGIPVLSVQEIIGMNKITVVPNTMSFMRGVINLRGTVVPVVDMRLRFGFLERDYDDFTVIIIVEIKNRLIGMIVDSVSDVADIPLEKIQDTPHFSSKIERDFIMGIGQVDELLIIVLDVEKILSEEEIKNL